MTPLRLSDLAPDARDALVKLAQEWKGFDPWLAEIAIQPDRDVWADNEGGMLPLHVGAGRDLGVRFLARLLGVECGATAPGWEREPWDDIATMYTWRLAGIDSDAEVRFTSDRLVGWRTRTVYASVEACDPGYRWIPGISTVTDPAEALRLAILAVAGAR